MKKKSIIFLCIALLLIAGCASVQSATNSISSIERIKEEVSAVKKEVEIIKQSVGELGGAVKDSTSIISALGASIDTLETKLQLIEDKLANIEKTINSNNTLPISNLILKYGSFVFGAASLLMVLLGFFYFYNSQQTKKEAEKNLEEIRATNRDSKKEIEAHLTEAKDQSEKIKEMNKESKEKKDAAIKQFDYRVKTLFNDAKIPDHLILTNVKFSGTATEKPTEEEIIRIEHVIREAYTLKASLFSKNNLDLSEVFVRIGHYYFTFSTDSFIKAQLAYESAIECYNQNNEAHFCKGLALLKRESYLLALNAIDEAIKINNNYWRYYYTKGWIYDEIKKYTEAIEQYSIAKNLNPQKGGIPYNIACSYSKMSAIASSESERENQLSNAYKYLEEAIGGLEKEKYKKMAVEDEDLQQLKKHPNYQEKCRKLLGL